MITVLQKSTSTTPLVPLDRFNCCDGEHSIDISVSPEDGENAVWVYMLVGVKILAF